MVMEKLKELRLLNNFSFADMAAKLCISKSFYWKLENEQCILNYKMALKIANIFKLRPDDIFYNDFKEKQGIIK